jgi:hypothetical protein
MYFLVISPILTSAITDPLTNLPIWLTSVAFVTMVHYIHFKQWRNQSSKRLRCMVKIRHPSRGELGFAQLALCLLKSVLFPLFLWGISWGAFLMVLFIESCLAEKSTNFSC